MASNGNSPRPNVHSPSVSTMVEWVDIFIQEHLPPSNEYVEDEGGLLTWEDLLSDSNFLDIDNPQDSPTSARLREIVVRYRSRVYEVEEDIAAHDDHLTNIEHANIQLADHVSEMATHCVTVMLERDTYAANMRKYRAIAFAMIAAWILALMIEALNL